MTDQHAHEFHGLWTHFGEFHRQADRHYHPCTVDDCPAMLVGVGRHCGGPGTRHHVCTWASEAEARGEVPVGQQVVDAFHEIYGGLERLSDVREDER